MTRQTIMERAFELARDGECHNVGDIKSALAKEGYSQVEAHFEGPSLKRQLSALIRAAKLPSSA